MKKVASIAQLTKNIIHLLRLQSYQSATAASICSLPDYSPLLKSLRRMQEDFTILKAANNDDSHKNNRLAHYSIITNKRGFSLKQHQREDFMRLRPSVFLNK